SNRVDYQMTDNTEIENYTGLAIESHIENSKRHTSNYYTYGKFIDYQEIEPGVIKVDNMYGVINVIYKGLILDDTGLPELTFKEMTAITTYIAYTLTQKQAFITRDNATAQFAMMLSQKWERECAH